MKADTETEEFQKRMAHIALVFRQRNLKLTHQRIEILNEVVKSGDHPDVESIHRGIRKRLPTVSLDTVYRTLWLLHDLGLIDTVGPSHERVRFDGNTEPHHHFVCKQCGAIYDFYSQEFDQLKVPEAIQALGHGEKINVEVRGLCRQCLDKKGES